RGQGCRADSRRDDLDDLRREAAAEVAVAAIDRRQLVGAGGQAADREGGLAAAERADEHGGDPVEEHRASRDTAGAGDGGRQGYAAAEADARRPRQGRAGGGLGDALGQAVGSAAPEVRVAGVNGADGMWAGRGREGAGREYCEIASGESGLADGRGTVLKG